MKWIISTALLCSVAAFLPIASGVVPCVDRSRQCKDFRMYCGHGSMASYCPITCNACQSNPCAQQNNGGCSHICNWIEEKIECGCPTGFKIAEDTKTCVDVNECTEGPNPCPKLFGQQYCVNTVGSFFCADAKQCSSNDSLVMNYYRSQECCNVKNSACGTTADIRSHLPQETIAPQPRILGGFKSSLAAWPWMGQLVSNGLHTCGGTLLSKTWMVTAAHCVSGTDKDLNIKVVLGHVQRGDLFVRTGTRVEKSIKKVIRHENPSQNDIALIELSSPVVFNDYISPVCLPCGDKPLTGDTCWATGFGSTSAEVIAPVAELREVDLPIAGINNCIKAFEGSESPVNRSTMMCAGYTEGGKDTCFGDGGGPLVCQRKDSCSWYLSGITSFGQGCGRPGSYGVYTNVLRFESWVKENMGETDAAELCTHDYNPCSGLTNHLRGCQESAYACNGQAAAGCQLTCCLRQFEREPSCFDSPGFGASCEMFKSKCEDRNYDSYMRTNCKKTCAFC